MLLRRIGYRKACPVVVPNTCALASVEASSAVSPSACSSAYSFPISVSSFSSAASSSALVGGGMASAMPPSSSFLINSKRFQHSGNSNSGANTNDTATARLLEEVLMLTSTPIPIGTLFKSLSQESRQVLMKMKLPLETFLLRHRDTFSVYKNADKGQIMASRVTDVPLSAMRGVEATTEQMFTGKAQESNLHAVYTVLKYIPNEWSPFVSLGIPEEIRIKFMNKKPKAFFEAHPKYFEVKAQALRSHTFEVRRSLELQKATAAQQQQQ